MQMNSLPESWNDKNMDWENPDPLNIYYWQAIILAIRERYMAIFSFSQNRSFSRYSLLSTLNINLNSGFFSDDFIKFLIEVFRTISSCSYNVDKLTNHDFLQRDIDMHATPSNSTRYNSLFLMSDYLIPHYPGNVSYGNYFLPSKLNKKALYWDMKLFMKNFKKFLDRAVVFPAAVKLTEYKNYHVNVIGDDDVTDENVKEKILQKLKSSIEEKEKKTVTGIPSVIMQQTIEHSKAMDVPKYNFYNPNIRSFCRPELWAVIKMTHGWSWNWLEYYDYNTGMKDGEVALWNYGQFSGIADDTLSAPGFDPYAPFFDDNVTSESNLMTTIEGIYLFNYNVEGGFKFRPDSEN